MNIKHDIEGIDDIRILVDVFYEKVAEDELLAPIFNFRLSSYWLPHLEKMYDFWNAALFGVKGYVGNPFSKHATMQLTEEHFRRWLGLFNETVDTHFAGPVAEDARRRALIMANNFERRLNDLQGDNKITLV
jgi:hemoglobin